MGIPHTITFLIFFCLSAFPNSVLVEEKTVFKGTSRDQAQKNYSLSPKTQWRLEKGV